MNNTSDEQDVYKNMVEDDLEPKNSNVIGESNQGIESEIEEKVEKINVADATNQPRDINTFIDQMIRNIKKRPPKEFDNEDEIARNLLSDLKDMIKEELESKQKSRNIITVSLMIAFGIIGLAMLFLIFFSMHYNTTIVLAMISGFFINTIGLVLVLLKYIFSPSKELYDYTLGIFKRKNGDQ